jgi:hypothetical protein
MHESLKKRYDASLHAYAVAVMAMDRVPPADDAGAQLETARIEFERLREELQTERELRQP